MPKHLTKKIKTLRTTSVHRIYKYTHVVNFMPATDEAAMPSISAWKQNPIHLHCTGVEANKPIAICMASCLPLLSFIWVCAPLQKFISTQNQHLGIVRTVKSAIARFDDNLKGNKKEKEKEKQSLPVFVDMKVKSYNGLLAMSVWLVDSLWTPYEVQKKKENVSNTKEMISNQWPHTVKRKQLLHSTRISGIPSTCENNVSLIPWDKCQLTECGTVGQRGYSWFKQCS